MPHSTRRWTIPLLLGLYTALAVAWGWRLHSHEAGKDAPDETIEHTRLAVVKRIAELPTHRARPALFQLGMLPDADIRALADWMDQVPMLRMRQITIQQGPVHTPCPLNDALVLAEIARSDAPPIEETRLLVAASGDRLEEPVKIEVLQTLAAQAMGANDPSLAVDVLLRACDSPATRWTEVLALAEASRMARRPAAALRIVNRWLDDASGRLTDAQIPEALDLQIALLIEGGRCAEASRITLDALRALPAKERVPEPLLERALRATAAAEETGELLPWFERQLRTYPREHAAGWEQIANGLETSDEYRRWLHHAACTADLEKLSGTACDYFFIVAATGDLRGLGRLHTLAGQVGRENDFARLLQALQTRSQDARSPIELARALAESSAPSAAHDLLVAHLKDHPDDREAAYALTEIDEGTRSPGAAAPLWERFLKDFPDDVAARTRLAKIQLASGQRSQALRTLQQIPGEKLDEATLRLIASLAEYLDDAVVAHRARELIVERQGKPTAADLMALAAVSPQIEDPAQAADVFRAFAAKVTDSPYVTALSADSLRHGNAGSFSTAAEQVRSAVPVEE